MFCFLINLLLARENFDHFNREELLHELDMALQYNEELTEQLRSKFF